MLRVIVACLAVCGCNQVFGLEQSTLIDAAAGALDQDSDGVSDSVDNCISVANTSQSDIDHDGSGDACDPCSFRFDPALDRDSDTIAAGADNCPGVPNASQTDGDGDGVGDACDPEPGAAGSLRCFADFWIDVPASWHLGGPWMVLGTDESSSIFHTPSDAMPFWLGAVASGLAASQIAVQVQLQPPQSINPSIVTASGVAVAAPGETAFAACELVRSNTSLLLRVSDAAGSNEITLPVSAQQMYVTLGYRLVDGALELHCESIASGAREQVTRTAGAPIDPSTIFLTATNASGIFRSLAVYTTAP